MTQTAQSSGSPLNTPGILIVAGSDPIAGAGMQADLKTAAAFNVYASCALTAITAQNTCEFIASQAVEPQMLAAQIQAVFEDMVPSVIKVGMLANAELANVVADVFEAHSDILTVVDPVLVSTTKGSLAGDGVLDVLCERILPRTTLLTPNVYERDALANYLECVPSALQDELFARGCAAVLLKGGTAPASDVEACEVLTDTLILADGSRFDMSCARRPGEFHGSGCTLSSAVAACLARGMKLPAALERAHAYVSGPVMEHALCPSGHAMLLAHNCADAIALARA